MSEKNIEMINEYFDDELDKNQEMFLFAQLSKDEEALEYFKKLQILKSGLTREEFPERLDEKILTNVIHHKESFYFSKKNLFQFSFAVLLIIFAVTSFLFYSETVEYKSILNSTVEKVDRQEEVIDALLNTLPVVEVQGETPDLIIIEGKKI